ncbi:RNA polymerase sigma factor [Microbacterium sp. SLBN-146]|uniref:RNA polymerase sigma factor n=1 Tax=Microbacterium sp. SLBN-146 TaxID=2768457 RepID=UPI001151B8F3|nr:sigma-70 family RNA polymerase sigma factor [Microbacterium sp. SLBN-146]TQJ30316.1 RNA polymerase ECF family sigma subunit [Microbacterium sp. SLBN-146]
MTVLPTATEVSDVLASAVADERLRIVATLIRRTGDWELAEDALQDAVAHALTAWRRRGIPDNPAAWLTTAARNAAVDALRRRATERTAAGKAAVEVIVDLAEERARSLGAPGEEPADGVFDDDRLRLIFTCCHPALSLEARVALTLRTVVGLDVSEIARAFLVAESAMQKRLVRARARIREAGIPYRVPGPERLPERTDGVLSVLYLLFTEGYSGSAELIRVSLADDAIRLTRLVASLMSDSPLLPEVLGLLALMQFQHSRAAARLDAHGELVLMDDQDRRRWDATLIGAGVATLAASESARRRFDGVAGPYRLQAEIAKHHATAPSAESTDFERIAELYARLARVSPSPVIELNRAVAVGFARGPEAGLVVLDGIDDARLSGYHLFHATRADLLRRCGQEAEALAHYTRALELAPSDPERRFLTRRIAALRAATSEAG